jgi:hypothetical protein
MTQNPVVISVVLLAIAYCPLLKKNKAKRERRRKRRRQRKLAQDGLIK